jgi:hypothetical protein
MAPLTEARVNTPLYLLYWYKRTNTGTARRVTGGAADRGVRNFTCFTGTKVQILTLRAASQMAPLTEARAKTQPGQVRTKKGT